ncbi:MAG: sigma factor [Pseudomonadota bacterium]
MNAGNEFEQELIRCLPRMLATATRILRDPAEAQDAVQDASLSAFRNFDSFDQRGELAGWLHRIVVNASLMRLRKRKSLAEDQVDELQPQYDQYGVLMADSAWRDVTPETGWHERKPAIS